MKTLRMKLLAVKHPLWDLARMGPSGLERVAQAAGLDEGVSMMLESTLTVDFPDHTRVRLILEVEYPEGTSTNDWCTCCRHYQGTLQCHGVDCQQCATCAPD